MKINENQLDFLKMSENQMSPAQINEITKKNNKNYVHSAKSSIWHEWDILGREHLLFRK